MQGFIVYDGPSEIDAAPIVAIATAPAQSRLNTKTGEVVQIYILARDEDPVAAKQSGADHAVCGDCAHRKGSCYVQLWSAPRNIWHAYRRGKYPMLEQPEKSGRLSGKVVRLGAYGDPAAVPFGVWNSALGGARAVLGYTHQWKTCAFAHSAFCMASVDSIAEQLQASARGWRTFRVRASSSNLVLLPGEIMCPASAEAGKKTSCSECRACGGHRSKARCDVAIVAHGDAGKRNRFRELANVD